MSFISNYFDVVEGAKEIAVLCPFYHFTPNGVAYQETRPSAHVNTLENLFHCKVCNVGYNEPQFIQQILDCTYYDAKRLQRCFSTTEDLDLWKGVTLTEQSKNAALNLGISEEVIQELHLKTPTGSENNLAFPVLIHDHIVDIRKYNPEGSPKVKSRSNCPTGMIIPFDLWRETPSHRTTLICAGEKDMAIARSHGFNAITITGGENTMPRIMNEFKNRKVAIVYDNDGPGYQGAKKLALKLYEYTPYIKIVNNFHEVCSEPGEDITDFFTKYEKTKDDLIEYIKNTPYFEPSEEDVTENYPIVDLITASKPENINKMLRSNIQVVAVSESTFATPAFIAGEKYKTSGNNDTLPEGTCKEWELSDETCQDILHLIDNGFKEDAIRKNILNLLKIPQKERCVKLSTLAKKTVFKAYVTDMFETTNLSVQPMEFVAYSLNNKLESGKKYMVTYKLVPHPYRGQELIMIVTNAIQANDSISNFQITPEVKEQLNIIRDLEGTPEERINLMVDKIKGLLGYDGNNTLIQTVDLAYHTPLQFNFGTFKNMRGYLDTLIVGESRMGKSSTANTMRELYGLGVFTSLAGNSATVPGLVGGSNKVNGTYQTRAGIIPQNHKGLIIFEEFGKSNKGVIAELTDIRSSNEVRITRVSGTITLPATVRMIALSNAKAENGTIKPIASYPNGISIITELVPTAEDIARYDLIVVLPDRGNSQIDPFWQPSEPFPKEVYETRIRWIWSREPEQIIIDQETGYYILEQANQLNQIYDCHIKIFGTEAWKKITRLAVAIAGYLVSTDDDYENIILTKDHVDYAITFLKRIYDNPTFKLREYVEHERKYVQVDDEAIANLQDIYVKYPSLILYLEQASNATKNMLGAASGLGNDDLNRAINRLTRGLFVKFQNHDIIPTERFRLALASINRNATIERVGE